MENELMIDPVKFTNDGKTYVYDKNEIGFWQIELARETLEYHASALENHAPNYQTASQSDIFDWQIIIMSFLLRREDENGNLNGFFYFYRDAQQTIADVSEKKANERARSDKRTVVVGSDGVDKYRQELERRERIYRIWNKDELKRRLNDVAFKIGNLPALCGNDVTKFGAVRYCLYRDVVAAVISLIENSPV